MDTYDYNSRKTGTNTIDPGMVTTTFELAGYNTVTNLGVARGIVVRSRSLVGSIGAGIQSLFGGNITLFTQLSEKSRSHAFDLLLEHASEMGANAIVGARYDATELAAGITEVLAYGTAVVVEKK
ncbi:MAG TPA: YbjQ family protein [Candidatus Paceibacterota bacterium]|nr:YbjQ family protein [Candidatus Paceibacterota bacterium]